MLLSINFHPHMNQRPDISSAPFSCWKTVKAQRSLLGAVSTMRKPTFIPQIAKTKGFLKAKTDTVLNIKIPTQKKGADASQI